MAGNKYADILSGEASPAAAPTSSFGSPAALTVPDAPAAQTNKYAGILGSEQQSQETAAKTSMFKARETPPERATQILGLSKETGLGPDLVSRNYEDLSKQQTEKSIDYRSMVSESPALTKFISDRHRAAAVQDDLPALSKVEETVRDQSLYARAIAALSETPTLAKVISHPLGYAADVFTAKENLKVQLFNMISEATGSASRLEPFKTPEILHDNLTGNALEVGLTQLESQVAHAPGYASDLYVAARNLRTRAGDAITGNTTAPIKTPAFLHDNAVTKYVDAQAEKAAAMSPEASQSTVKLMMQGDYAKAGRTAYYNLIVNAPNLAVMMTMGRMQMAAEVAAYAAGTTGSGAAGENAAMIREQNDQASIPESLRDPSAAQVPPLNPDVATLGAYTKGAAEALFEHVGTYLPMRAWEDAVFNMGGKAAIRETVIDFSKTMLRTIFSNAAEESLTQGAQDLTDYYTGVNPDALKGIGLRMMDAGVIGGLTGGVLVAPGGAASGFARKAYQAEQIQQAQVHAEFIANLAGAAGESKTASRSPDLATDFVKSAVEGSPVQDVHLDPEAVKKYFQSKGLNPTAEIQKLGVLPEFGAAEETGGTVKMPLERFVKDVVQAGHADLINDAKFSEEAMSVNETKAFESETKADVRAADTEATAIPDAGPVNERGLTAEQQVEENRKAVRDDVVRQIEAAGQTREHAEILTRILDTTATRLGADPLELYRRLNLTVNGPDQARADTDQQSRVYEQARRTFDHLPGTNVLDAADLFSRRTEPQDGKQVGKVVAKHGSWFVRNAEGQLFEIEDAEVGKALKGQTLRFNVNENDSAIELADQQGNEVADRAKNEVAVNQAKGWLGEDTARGLSTHALTMLNSLSARYSGETDQQLRAAQNPQVGAYVPDPTIPGIAWSPNYAAEPTGTIGEARIQEPASMRDGEARAIDPLAWHEDKYKATQALIDRHVAAGIPLTINTSSDLIGKEGYFDRLPPGTVVNMYLLTNDPAVNRVLFPGNPSRLRQEQAVEKLREQGVTVNAIRPTFESVMEASGGPERVTKLLGEDGEAAVRKATFGLRLAQGGDNPLGYISVGESGINIQLLATADRSTAVHEFGHFVVEMMKDLSLNADTPQQIKDDFATLMKHVGNDGGEITTAQHEELARSFEAYLMEGKAPSRGLRKAFNTIKTWMVDVYQHLSGLNVKLSDDVRAVFDRVLATDDEIEAATGRQSIEPLFADPAKYNMTPDQLADYQSAQDAWRLAANDELRADVMEDIRKEETELYQAELARVTAEVTAQVNAVPVYQALAALQTAKTTTGEDVQTFGLGRLKIDRAAVVAMYGEDVAKEMPRATTTRDGGLHPDQIAPLFGFVDGAELIDAMRAVEPRQQVIDRGVESEMNRLDPKLFQSTLMPDQAMRAIHNGERSKILKLEMEHALRMAPAVVRKVTQFATKRMPTDQVIRDQVGRVLGAKKVSDITPNAYRIAERKAAAEAGRALAAGDFDAVFEAKRKELINHELYRAAISAREEMTKDLRFFRKLNRSDEQLSKTRDVNMVQAARAVLAAFGIGQEGKAPSEYLEALKRYDPEGYEAAARQVLSATENGSGNYKSVKFDDYVAMRDSVKALWSLSKSSKEIEIEGRKMQSEQLKSELIGQVLSIAPAEKAEYTRSQNKWEKAKAVARGFRADMTRVETWAQAMDVKGIGGPFTSYIFRPVSEAVTKYRLEKAEKLEKLAAIYADNRHIFTHERIVSDELRHEFKDKSELLMAILHSGNESNFRKLLVGRGWGTIGEDGTLDRSRWDAFKTRMESEGKLTKGDYDFAQRVWDLNEEMKAGAQKAHKAMLGFHFNEITASPIQTPFGEYRGGYIPAKLDIEQSETAKIRGDREAFEGKNNSWQFPTTGRGFTKSRVEQFAGPLSLNMNMLGTHLDQVLRFTHIEPRVKEVARMVNDEELRENLKLVDGNIASDALVPWLQRAAAQKIVTPSQTAIGRATDRFAAYIRRGVAGNVLVLNLTNGLQQLTGYQVAASKVAPTFITEAMTIYYRNPKKVTESIMEMSPWMRSTQGDTVRDTATFMNQILTDPSTFDNIKNFSAKHGQFLQSGFQNMVNTPVWLGAYNEALSKGETHDNAVFSADSAVRTTQGTQNAEDISRFETGTETERMFKYFASYFNMLANLNQSEFQKIARDVGLKKGAGRAFYLYMMAIALPAVTAELITQGMGGHVGPEDDESWAFYALKTYFGSQFRVGVAMIPYVGMAANAAYGQFTKQQYDDRLSLSPAISALEAGIGVPKELYERIVHKARNERKLTRDVLGLVGIMTQLPLQPLSKPINYVRDVKQNRIRPKNGLDYARGLVTGKGERR